MIAWKNNALGISDRDAETPQEGPPIILLKIRKNESSNFWHLRIDFYRKKGESFSLYYICYSGMMINLKVTF